LAGTLPEHYTLADAGIQLVAASLIRVLIVDDSAIIRSMINGALQRHPQIQVVGQAADGVDALKQMAALRPDVVTLDVEMPNMNGIGVLQRAAGKVPVSFLMVSTLTLAGARVTFEALNRGAFDYVTKPDTAAGASRPDFQRELVEKVLAAFNAKGKTRQITRSEKATAAPQLPPNQSRGWVVAIGISCGGPQTLHRMLPSFPSDFVPIVLTQHMPAQFTGPFAQHLDAECAMRVREARHGEPLQYGTVLVAPGDQHLKVVRRGTQLTTELDSGPQVSGHKPAVDVMFSAVAAACGPRCVSVVMTGMGSDGAKGTVAIATAGGRTVAQDSASSLVYGMPKAAAETGRVQHVVPLDKIPATIARLIQDQPVSANRPVAGGGR
jgi:two-component system chemotaxis response regulator CheB